MPYAGLFSQFLIRDLFMILTPVEFTKGYWRQLRGLKGLSADC